MSLAVQCCLSFKHYSCQLVTLPSNFIKPDLTRWNCCISAPIRFQGKRVALESSRSGAKQLLSFSTFFLTCVNAGGVSNAFQTRAPASAPFGLTLQTFLAQSVVVQHLLCEDGFQVHCKFFNGPLCLLVRVCIFVC